MEATEKAAAQCLAVANTAHSKRSARSTTVQLGRRIGGGWDWPLLGHSCRGAESCLHMWPVVTWPRN